MSFVSVRDVLIAFPGGRGLNQGTLQRRFGRGIASCSQLLVRLAHERVQVEAIVRDLGVSVAEAERWLLENSNNQLS